MSSKRPPMAAAGVREARRARTRTLRRRVVAGGVALFLATWVLIAVELVTGHDPALASRKTSTVAASSAQSATTTTTSAEPTTATTTSAQPTSTTTSSAQPATATTTTSSVTTRQS